jgi:hypothetical protein
MANIKITDLTAYTDPLNTDVLPIVDVTSDTTKKVSIADLLKNASAGTAAAPGIAFDGDNTGIYSPGADQLAISTNGTGRLFVDASGNVGVGADATTDKLETSGNIRLQDVAGTIKFANDFVRIRRASNVLTFDSYSGFSFYDTLNTTERLHITSDGKLGVGISSPQATCHVNGAILSSSALIALSASNIFFDQPTSTLSRIGVVGANTSTVGTLSISQYSSNGSVGRDVVHINSLGNVGIGTVSPSRNLTVSDGTNAIISVQNSGLSTEGVFNAPSGGTINLAAIGSTDLTLSTNALERVRLDSSGRLLVGTTTEGNANADDLTISNSGNCGMTIRSGSSNAGVIYFSDATSGTAEYDGYIHYQQSAQFLSFGTAATERARIDSSGNFLLGGTLPVSPNISLNANGSATFAGNVDVGNWPTVGSRRTNSGAVLVNRADAGTSEVWSGRFSGTETSRINADGSATFGGDVIATGGNVKLKSEGSGGKIQIIQLNTATEAFQLGTVATPSAVALKANGSAKFAGSVGIGTTSPGQKLHVSGGQIYVEDTSEARIYLRPGGTNTGLFYADASRVQLEALGTLPLTFYAGGGEKARIDSSGRLLVGTSSARANMFNSTLSSVFQVEGTTHDTSSVSIVRNSNNSSTAAFVLGKSRSTAAGGSTLVNDGDTIAYLTFQGADGAQLVECASIAAYIDGTPGANDMPGRLVFSTTADGASSPTERMRISANGKVSIGRGTTNLASFTTGAYLKLSTGADTTTGDFSCESYAGNAGTRYHFGFSNTNGLVGSITTNSSATAYNTSSDYRLKENVVPLTGAADRVNQLQVHRFNFIADPDETVDGFLAHEAQAVVPECVTGTKDAVDDEGNPVYQGIDQSKMVPLLTAALQEALAKIETLEQRLSDAGIA